MASSGPNNPGTIANSGAGTAWSNTANVAASDNTYATCSLTQESGSQFLRCTNFGFSIPADAHIQGILVEVEKKASASFAIFTSTINLVFNGTALGSQNVVDYWPTTDTNKQFGSSTSYWSVGGGGLTPVMINDSTFGFQMNVYNEGLGTETASIDHAKMTVYYQAATYTASPGTIAEVVNNSDTSWNTISNAGASDNAYASALFQVPDGVRSHELKCTNFGLSIPTHLKIKGFKVRIERNASVLSNISDYKVQFYRSGVLQTVQNKAAAGTWPTSDAYQEYGGEDDLWGLDDLSPADFNDSTTGVMLQCQAALGVSTANVDHVEMIVYTSQYAKGSLALTGVGR